MTRTIDATEFRLTPAELQAIEEHKYFLSTERGHEVSIEEAIGDFLRRYAESWRRDKAHRDNREQLEEIERHKYLRSAAEGRDIGEPAAAEEWCTEYAAIWRAERESLERNGFRRLAVTVRNAAGMHLRPWSRAARLVGSLDCDVYVHREGMEVCNFRLEGRPFMNVKSVLAVLSLGTTMGDTLEFIATGREADAALEALRELIEQEIDTPA